MNKRIKELAAQAGYKDLPTVRLAFDGFDKEKFALLIVRECAGIYELIDNGNLYLGTENYIEALKKNFGVE